MSVNTKKFRLTIMSGNKDVTDKIIPLIEEQPYLALSVEEKFFLGHIRRKESSLSYLMSLLMWAFRDANADHIHEKQYDIKLSPLDEFWQKGGDSSRMADYYLSNFRGNFYLVSRDSDAPHIPIGTGDHLDKFSTLSLLSRAILSAQLETFAMFLDTPRHPDSISSNPRSFSIPVFDGIISSFWDFGSHQDYNQLVKDVELLRKKEIDGGYLIRTEDFNY